MLLLFGIVIALALTACQAEGFVDVDVAPDGSGWVRVTVRLDKEAAAKVGDPSKLVRVDDLRDAGWMVTAPDVSDKGVTFSARKSFGSPNGLQSVMSEVVGAEVFNGWRLSVTDGFGSSTVAVKGSIRLDGSLDQLSDADLAGALDGLPFGRTPDDLAAEAGGAAPTLPVTVRVRLPAEIDHTNGAATSDSAVRQWRVVIGDGEARTTKVVATSTDGGSLPIVLLVLAGAALVAGLGLGLTVTARRRSTRRR